MLNLKSISDDVLLNETQRLMTQERELLSQILRHLREIERRRLYSKLKMSSLFEYATRELGYSEDQAFRRIQAMRLLKELPEIEEKINDGSLNLSHMGMAQALFKREEKLGAKTYSKDEKIELLKKLENTSKREAEKITLEISPLSKPSLEKVTAISNENFEIKFTAKEELLKKIQRLKGLLAHKNPHLSLSELIDQLCDLGLEKWDKSAPFGCTAVPAAPARVKRSEIQAQVQSQAQIRREVWRRDNGECQICRSHYALEIDHQIPKAMGGDHSLDNLRLLCRSCNQRAAIEAFGLSKMEKYLDG